MRTIRDGEPSTTTSTFRQLLSDNYICFYVEFFKLSGFLSGWHLAGPDTSVDKD